MKNLKKVLALVVVFTMMLSTVAFAAYPDVAEDADYATAVEVLSALEILKGDDKGNFNPDADITRAEFAAVVCRALGLEDSANGAKGSTAFADVAADHWATGYINLANQMGIINGYGDGNFGPEDKVTYEQAVKMLVCSLGFEYMAQTKGGWPTGYLVVANNYGVTAGVKATAGEPAARSIVAELTYNALDAATMEQGTFGTEENWYVYDGISRVKKTLLSEKLDIAKLTGVVIANSKSALTGATVTEKDEIQFEIKLDVVDKFGAIWNATGWAVGDQPKFKIADSNADAYFANQVDIYVTEVSRNVWEVVAITEEAGKNVTTTIATSDVDVNKTVTNALTYNPSYKDVYYYKSTDAKVSTKIEGAASVALLVNNSTGTWTTYVAGLNSAPAGQIQFIDWDNDYKFDAVLVSEYAHAIVDSVNTTSGMIKTKTTGLKNINLKIDDEDVNVSIKDKKGNKVALEDIKEDDVLAMIADSGNPMTWVNTLDIIVIPAAEATVTGSVSELEIATPSAGSITALDKIYVDGTAYGLNVENGGNRIYNFNKLVSVNSTGTFYLDINGRIIGFDGDKAVDGDYAFILQTGLSNDPVSTGKILMKVLTKDGEIKTYTVADTVTIPGKVNTTGTYNTTNTTDVFTAIETFTDANGNGVWDAAEAYIDANRNGSYDLGETFTDANGNGVWDAAEAYIDANRNGSYDDTNEFAATQWSAFNGMSVKNALLSFGALDGLAVAYDADADGDTINDSYSTDTLSDRFVKLGVNSSGKVTRIVVADVESDFTETDKTSTAVEYKAADTRFGGNILTDGAIIFVLDSKDAYEASTVKTVGEAFVDEGEYKLTMYKDGATTYDAALVIAGTSKLTNTDGISIVKSVSATKTAENDNALIIRFIQNGSDEVKTITIVDGEGTDLTGANSATLNVASYDQADELKTGDVFTYTATADGEVETFAVIARLDESTKKFTTTTYFGSSNTPGYDGYTKDVVFDTGYITDIEGAVVSLSSGNSYSISNANEYYFKRYSASRYDLSTGAYQLGYVDEYDSSVSADRTYVLIKTVDDVVTDIYAFDGEPRANN